ncbi:MAG: deoxyribose-phosphate aldolase [Sphaerochaetaceae bacterium]|nr:deoxyribose-phosphate aldolase [Spirochaetales bacterium]MDY5499630.1 deoxyribose-phosphate aldolase [Sphaerochaetaceae bacterium]
MEPIANYIDHTLLRADATQEEIEKLCQEAEQYHFHSVCVNGCWVDLCSKLLSGTGVKVCTVVGFPLGAMTTRAKAFEARQAIADGADEVDMVINIGQLKNHDDSLVQDDIAAVKLACRGHLLKVIIECCLLTKEEKVRACRLAVSAGADYVKTSTGFSTGGATVDDVTLMRRTVGPNIGVKASGGIHSYPQAKAMIGAGATRIGASAGIAIVKGQYAAV